MTQVYYRANLNDEEFPLISKFQGKTVIQPAIDQNYQQSLFDKGANDKGIPEAYYMHNVMPSIHGYKSVSYVDAIAGVDGVLTFDKVFQVKDFDGNRGLIAICLEGKTYMLSSITRAWKEVTPPGQPASGQVTTANVTGTTFICYANWGIFSVDLINQELDPANIQWDSPLTNASITGISASNNYMLAHDGSTLYWSSALDVLDFKASQITGAGSGTPTAAIGNIIFLSPVGVGFAVYCQGNIVVASFSGNVQYPWLFKEAPNGSGIADITSVTSTGEDNSNYAWTTAGLLKVTLGGCTTLHPAASDFIGGRVYEDFDTATNTFSLEYLASNLKVRLAFVASRFLCISYGPTLYRYTLVYDVALKRWGKLKQDHVQLFEVSYEVLFSIPTYYDIGLVSYQSYATDTYNSMSVNKNIAPSARHSLAVMAANGAVKMAIVEYGDYNSDAVLLLGKYQIFRANTVAIQGFTIESIDSDNANFKVKVLTSIDGKNPYLTYDPHEEVADGIRQYDCLSIGQNHSLLIKGAFHITALVLVFSKNGNR
jgi:hypothetical protein